MEQQLEMYLPDDGSPAARSGLLTVAEAAVRARCCERTIRRAIAAGDLRAGRVRCRAGARGLVRIRPRDLEAWIFGDGS